MGSSCVINDVCIVDIVSPVKGMRLSETTNDSVIFLVLRKCMCKLTYMNRIQHNGSKES